MSPNDRELPVFTWDGSYWTAKVKLRSWSRFVTKGARGFVDIEITPPDSGADPPTPPSDEQRAAIAHLFANEERVGTTVSRALLAQYQRAQRDWDDDEKPLRPLKAVMGLEKHVKLNRINVLAMAKQKQAYLGFSFGCSWEEEHGAGVMTHKTRKVVDGGADCSFLWWLAKRDGGAPLKAAPAPRAKAAAAAKPRAGARSRAAAEKTKPRAIRKK